MSAKIGDATSYEWTEADDVIEGIWEIRRQMWARFDNDPKKLLDHLREWEKHYTGPRIDPPARRHGTSSV